ncbi:MAG: FAD binding domain-containing protein [Treponema sp.]|jgi:CO/xanthine dehydrogenase FAD-binding subunit|nr:FAD binding domain-containing protein [Treponema sp.]
MDAPLNHIFFPISFNELFSTWDHFPEAVPYAGGTDLIGRQGKNIINLPKVILCLDKLAELHRVTRTEQYLEIGSMVNLNTLIRLGKISRSAETGNGRKDFLAAEKTPAIVPKILSTCLENIAGIQLRNTATIGGNICSASYLYDLAAPFTALDAQYELRSANTSRWVSALWFHSSGERVLESQELLTRVRLPLYQWDYSIYKKFRNDDLFSNEILIFLAKAQKNILTDIKVVYKANTILRNKNGEDILNGKILPLSRKMALDFLQNWQDFLGNRSDITEFSKNAIISNIEENVFILSE